MGDVPSTGANTGLPNALRSDLSSAPNQPRTIAVQVTWKY
jgi:hypothetical protein